MASKFNTSENVSHATSWCHMTWYMPPCYFSGRYSPNLIFAPVSNEEYVLLGKSHGSCQVDVPCSHRITAYTLNWFDTLSKPGWFDSIFSTATFMETSWDTVLSIYHVNKNQWQAASLWWYYVTIAFSNGIEISSLFGEFRQRFGRINAHSGHVAFRKESFMVRASVNFTESGWRLSSPPL